MEIYLRWQYIVVDVLCTESDVLRFAISSHDNWILNIYNTTAELYHHGSAFYFLAHVFFPFLLLFLSAFLRISIPKI